MLFNDLIHLSEVLNIASLAIFLTKEQINLALDIIGWKVYKTIMTELENFERSFYGARKEATDIVFELTRKTAVLRHEAAERVRERVTSCLEGIIDHLPDRFRVSWERVSQSHERDNPHFHGFMTEYVVREKRFEIYDEEGIGIADSAFGHATSRRSTDRTVTVDDWLWLGPLVLEKARRHLVDYPPGRPLSPHLRSSTPPII